MALREVTVSTAGGKFKQTVRVGPHELVSDEPTANTRGRSVGKSAAATKC